MGDLADEWNLQVLWNRINEDGRKGIRAIVFFSGERVMADIQA